LAGVAGRRLLESLAKILLLAGRREAAIEQGTEALRLYQLKGHVVGADRTRRMLEKMSSDANTP